MNTQIDDWLSRFDAALTSGDVSAVTALFEPNGYWRDILSFTWNLVTLEGRDSIGAMLETCLAGTAPSNWRPTSSM